MHKDFEKILKDFAAFWGDQDGRKRFNDWVALLKLDTSKPYGSGAFKESFKWADNVIKAIREDKDHKFYKVQVGFALESMNGNIYTREQIVRGARTLSGLVPNWNHTGTPVEGAIAVDAEEEDGIVEAIAAVRRDAKNLHGHLVTDCLDLNPNVPEDEHVIHVSLEADDRTDGELFPTVGRLYFSGWAFLERKNLPGIPLTRFTPIERIRKEALDMSTPPPAPDPPVQEPAVVDPPAEPTPAPPPAPTPEPVVEPPKKEDLGTPQPEVPAVTQADIDALWRGIRDLNTRLDGLNQRIDDIIALTERLVRLRSVIR